MIWGRARTGSYRSALDCVSLSLQHNLKHTFFMLYAICCIISCRYVPVYLIALLFKIPYSLLFLFFFFNLISRFCFHPFPALVTSFQDANIHWSLCLSFKVLPSSCLSPTFIKRTRSTSTRSMGSTPTRRSTRRTWTCSRYDIMYLLSQ